MSEILTIRRDFEAGVYFFRSESKQGLDLQRLREEGLILVKVAHPGYAPFDDTAFLDNEEGVRDWARSAASDPCIDGLALDIEGPVATTHKHVLRILAEEARAHGKPVHAVPHFALFDRWDDALTPQEVNQYADVVWPWLYNRFGQTDYGRGLEALLAYWTGKGVKRPVYPIFDHGRTHYSGITPAEASKVPLHLEGAGVDTVCLFQPHISYRARASHADYAALWRNLRTSFGGPSVEPAGEEGR
jgi:hypothetical protein